MGVVTRFGPDPSSRYYKLDEQLLWHEGLEPLPKLLLIDFFHRERKDEPVPPIGERARRLGVSYDSVARAEERLEADGYLLRGQRAGKACRYVAAFPPVPVGDPRRADFQELLERVLAVPDPPQNAVTHLPQNHGTTSRKMLEPLPQNAGGSENHSLLGGTKKKKGEESACAPDPLFSNPAGVPPKLDPLPLAVNNALFVYCDESDRWKWRNQLEEACRRYQQAGRPFRLEMLAAAAAKGRAAAMKAGRGPRPQFLDEFRDALAAELAAAESAAAEVERRRVERAERDEHERRAAEGEKARQEFAARRQAAVAGGPGSAAWNELLDWMGGGEGRRYKTHEDVLRKWWHEARPPLTAAEIAADPVLARNMRPATGRQLGA